MTTTDFLIIGGGPAGLSCATTLSRAGHEVFIIEREPQLGGIPRHCGHYPFGLREAHRLLKGPQYAAWLVSEANKAGIKALTNTTALSRKGMQVELSSTKGLTSITANNIILATGVREASRAQRNIAGTKTAGVINTGALQGLIYLSKQKPFRNPVIIGSELVSYSAINSCKHLGINPVALIDESPSPKARAIFTLLPPFLNIPTHYDVHNITVHGRNHVSNVTFSNNKGKQIDLPCDGVIISGQFRPEATIARNFELEIDSNCHGPAVDQFAMTSEANIFAIGNGLRAVETAGWCWQEGKNLGQFLAQSPTLSHESVPIKICSSKIKYVVPSRLALDTKTPVLNALQIRLNQKTKGILLLKSGDRVLLNKKINSRTERRITLPLNTNILKELENLPRELSLSFETLP